MHIPVVEEQLRVGRRRRRTGATRIDVRTRLEMASVEVETDREVVSVERVRIDRVVDHPAEVRVEGDVTIVPMHEEIVVVTKQLVLKEELHITKAHRREVTRHEEPVRKQVADVHVAEPATSRTEPK